MPTVKDKKTGDVVSQQPYTAEGTQRAETIVQANPDWELDYAPNGKTDGAQRSKSYQLGGQVPGQPGFGQRPSPMPNPYGYEKGGKTLSYAEAQAEQRAKYKEGVAERKAKYESRDEKPKEKPKTKKKSYNELRQEASEKYKSFGQTFKRARESGVKKFTWKGKKYTTKRK
jgi:hypothetical protein